MKASEIKKLFGHKLIGSQFMKRMVTKTLQFFPLDIIKKITKTTWFVGSFEDGWAFTIRGNELKKNEHLVFLADELLDEDERQIIWTIAHEIGHVILGHRNSIGRIQSKSEIRRQEKEADEFAKKYLGV
jgi:Zn-dependent protease with chaperone function